MKKFLSFAAALLLCGNVWAQSAAVDDLGNELTYRGISDKLANIEKMTKAENPDIDAIVKEVSYLNETSIKLDSARQAIDTEVKLIEKRVEALGEVDDKLPEAKIILQKRKEFNRELADEKAKLSEIDILSAKIDELNLRIFDIRNQMLWGNLLKPSESVISPSVFVKISGEFLSFVADMASSPAKWYKGLPKSARETVKTKTSTVIIFIGLICVIGYFLRRFMIRQLGYRQDIESPRLGRKIVASLAVWCGYGIIPTAIIGLCLYWLVSGGILKGSFLEIVLPSALYYLLYVIMGRASCRVVLTPYNEKWRLINIPTDKAKRLTKAIYLAIDITGIFAFMQNVVTRANYSLELLDYLLSLSASIKVLCVVWIAHIWFADNRAETEEETDNEGDLEAESRTFRIGILVSLFSLVVIGLALFGYARLSSFIVNRSILSAIVIAVFSIFRRLIYDILQHVLLMGLWVKTFRMRRAFLRKIDFWFGIVVEPLLFLLLVGVILLLWGVPADVLQATVYKAISGFTVGGIRISLISIFWGIVVFIVCLWLIKLIRNRIEFKMLEQTNIDTGTKHSLASGFAYIGYVLAGLLAIAVMGGDLANIALIAGALSVGVGLGLQNVVNNFVSGIIMLFERPIKVGDWVMVNGNEGSVKQINIRSTEIETFNRSSIIIPNAQVLSNAVTNLTHQNNWVRYAVKVGVAYGSDVEKVRKVLLDCALAHPRVTKKPAPYVLFQDFGANSLDFELRFYVSNIWDGWEAPSDIRYMINKRFIEEGIEIPFNQIVVHQGSHVAKETAAQFYAKGDKKNAD